MLAMQVFVGSVTATPHCTTLCCRTTSSWRRQDFPSSFSEPCLSVLGLLCHGASYIDSAERHAQLVCLQSRKYANSLDYALDSGAVPTSVVENLISVTRRDGPKPFQRYHQLRKVLFGGRRSCERGRGVLGRTGFGEREGKSAKKLCPATLLCLPCPLSPHCRSPPAAYAWTGEILCLRQRLADPRH
jgi:hypothetical protein